jgi:cell wall-associated NlpC family hydrolase
MSRQSVGARRERTVAGLPWTQRGGVSIAALGCIALILMLCLFTADVGLYLSARGQAQNAADAAALAAVQESFPLFTTGAGPESAARKFAKANGASVDRLDISDGGQRATVRVAVNTKSLLLKRLGIGPDSVSAISAAEVDIDALLASGSIWYTPDPATIKALKSLLSSAHPKDFHSAATLVCLLALQHLGKPYVWGATGPDSFDCSGLICYVYAQIGIQLPRVTFSQVCTGRAVSPSELAPGDLIFFRHNAHVGMFLGGGWFIHAPHTGDVVRISPLASRSDISACRRVL